NPGTVPRSIYVPRGNYKLTIPGSLADTQGDIRISNLITIIGTGAGESIIDVTGPGSSLTLSGLTLTGGLDTGPDGGGAITVTTGATLNLDSVALVGN